MINPLSRQGYGNGSGYAYRDAYGYGGGSGFDYYPYNLIFIN